MGNNTYTRYLEPTAESVNATFEKMKLCDTGVFYAYYKDISTGEAVVVPVAVPVHLSYDGQGMSEVKTMGLTPVRRELLCLVNSRKE